MAEVPKLVWTAEALAGAGFRFRHPLDDDSETVLIPLSRLTGLQRAGVNIVRIPPGKRAFPLHRHHVEEEWVYILSGTAELRMDSERHRLEAGCFVAFPPGGPAHAVRNASARDELVYLTGGENAPADIVDFPESGAGRRLVRAGPLLDTAAADGFAPFDFFENSSPPESPA